MGTPKQVERLVAPRAVAPRTIGDRIRALARGGPPSIVSTHASLEVIYFCDTTGSMYPYFDRVRASLCGTVERLARECARVEHAVYAYKNHGDEERFFDGVHPFVYQPFAADPRRVTDALHTVRQGGGGDGFCAIEDAFHHAAELASHGPSASGKRVAVVIGDMPPHGVLDRIAVCPNGYDYRVEVERLHGLGYAFYAVYCSAEDDGASERKQRTREYFQWLARATKGRFLDLVDIDALADLLTGICMKEVGALPSFLAEIEQRRALPLATRRLLAALASPSNEP